MLNILKLKLIFVNPTRVMYIFCYSAFVIHAVSDRDSTSLDMDCSL